MSHWPSILSAAQRAMTAVVGEPVMLVSDAANVMVRGVLLASPVESEVGGADYRDTAPELHLRQSETPEWVERGTVVEARGQSFVVFDVVRDGEGMVVLRLRCQ